MSAFNNRQLRGKGGRPASKTSELRRLGYLRVNNVLSPELLDELTVLTHTFAEHGGIRKHHGLRQPHAFRKAPFISKLFEQPEFVSLIDEVFEEQHWFLTNHADLHINALSGWHKDDGMSYGSGGYFSEPSYHLKNTNVYKVAVYFQSHCDFQDGLTVIPKSHRSEVIHSDNDIEHYLDTNKGDVLIFDTRLSHTGQVTPIPKALTKSAKRDLKAISTRIQEIEKQYKREAERNEQLLHLFRNSVGYRVSVFFTVATSSGPSNTFAVNNMLRQLGELEDGTSPSLPMSVRERLRPLGVSTIDDQAFWQEKFSQVF